MITSGDADSEAQPHGAEGGSDPHQLLSRLPEPTQRRMKPTDFSLWKGLARGCHLLPSSRCSSPSPGPGQLPGCSSDPQHAAIFISAGTAWTVLVS